jgi:branched-chain amino acid transport system substrate-binding protein
MRARLLLWTSALLLTAAFTHAASAQKQYGPGVTDTEIKIGQTMPYSGPASAYGIFGRVQSAYMRMINDHGGIHGRKITLISLDDGYSPPKAMELTRRLVESDHVLGIFDTLGTPANSAIQHYLNSKHVPHFAISGASRFNDPEHFPWSMSVIASFEAEGAIYGKYILQNFKNAKIGVLYQDDDLGKDYVKGLQEALGDQAERMIVKALSYEVTDATVDSQIVTLKASGADVFFMATTARFAAQSIRKAWEIGWRPTRFVSLPGASVPSALVPAGVEKAVGVMTAMSVKDASDPAWSNDKGMQDYFAFMKTYYPDGDPRDDDAVTAYHLAQAMVYLLEKCGDNLSRENVMRQATNMHGVEFPLLLPGIRLNTSPTNYRTYDQMRLARFDGKRWVPFGDIMSE